MKLKYKHLSKLLGVSLRPWQIEMLAEIDSNPKIVLKAARRSGKTWLLAFYATYYLMLGRCVIIALPNFRSSESILLDMIVSNIEIVMTQLPWKFTTRNTNREKKFNNKARLLVLTGFKTSIKEGYGADLVIIDETQRLKKENVLPIFEPFLEDAFMEGHGKIILSGIGGPRNSLIVEAPDIGYKKISFPSSYIRTLMDEPTRAKYDVIQTNYKLSLGPDYDANYECADIVEGGYYLFTSIPPRIPKPKWCNTPEYLFGIDVGGTSEHSDFTVVIVIEDLGGKMYNIIDMLKIRNVRAMAESGLITDFINRYDRRRGSVGIEVNGIGHKTKDILYETGMRDIVSVQLMGDTGPEKKRKEYLAREAEKLVRHGQLGTDNQEIKRELERIMISVDNDGKKTYTHSDIFSALLIATHIIGGNVFGVV
jgi:hypothetical protein